MSETSGAGAEREFTEAEVLQAIGVQLKKTNAHLLTIKWVLVITMVVVPLVLWLVVVTSSSSGL